MGRGCPGSVTGLPMAATAGGSVTVSRTDVTGQAPLAIAVANAGSNGATVKTQLSVGAYAVAYSAPSGYVLAAGVSNVQAAVIGRGGDSVSVTFAVTAVAAAPASYGGLWSGTTSDGGPISFTVAGTAVSNITVPFRLTGSCGVGGAAITVNGTDGFVSGQTLTAGDSTSVIYLSGTFSSATQAAGSALTVYTTTAGKCTGSNTWVAQH